MECFVHGGVQAVGICHSCHKAVCPSCVKDIGFAIVCSDACAKEAAELREENQRAIRLMRVAGKKPNFTVLTFAVFSIMLVGVGVYQSLVLEEAPWFPIIGAITFGVLGLTAYRRSRELGE